MAEKTQSCVDNEVLNVTYCHICNAQILSAHVREHSYSVGHLTLLQLATNAAARYTQHNQIKFQTFKTHKNMNLSNSHYCIKCNKVMLLCDKSSHEQYDNGHKLALRREEFILNFYTMYSESNDKIPITVKGLEIENVQNKQKDFVIEKVKSNKCEDTTLLEAESLKHHHIMPQCTMVTDFTVLDSYFKEQVIVVANNDERTAVTRYQWHGIFDADSVYFHCHVCGVFTQELGSLLKHVQTDRHVQATLVPVKNKHCIREFPYTNHCIICNTIFNEVSAHVARSRHSAALAAHRRLPRDARTVTSPVTLELTRDVAKPTLVVTLDVKRDLPREVKRVGTGDVKRDVTDDVKRDAKREETGDVKRDVTDDVKRDAKFDAKRDATREVPGDENNTSSYCAVCRVFVPQAKFDKDKNLRVHLEGRAHKNNASRPAAAPASAPATSAGTKPGVAKSTVTKPTVTKAKVRKRSAAMKGADADGSVTCETCACSVPRSVRTLREHFTSATHAQRDRQAGERGAARRHAAAAAAVFRRAASGQWSDATWRHVSAVTRDLTTLRHVEQRDGGGVTLVCSLCQRECSLARYDRHLEEEHSFIKLSMFESFCLLCSELTPLKHLHLLQLHPHTLTPPPESL